MRILKEIAERRSALRRASGQAVDPSTPLPSRLRSELTASRVNRAGSLKLKGERAKRWLARRGYPHPPVFFVRVANKGLRLDAASTFEELNTTGELTAES